MKKLLPILALFFGNLAVAYDFEQGLAAYKNKHYQAAIENFEEGAALGDPRAQYWLGYTLDRLGYSGPISEAISRRRQVKKLFRASAEQGYARAQWALGTLYASGRWGVKQDYTKAANWFRLSAEQDFPTAAFALAGLYKDGLGVPQDYTEAAKWYQLSAESGLIGAQYAMGNLNAEGLGVPQSFELAVEWWNLAAEQGLSVAQEKLGLAYASGKGVLQNYVKAYMWLNIAAANGSESSGMRRTEVAALMTRQQIAQAQKMSEECLTSSYEVCG